jgi:O-antigen ligase
MGEIRHLLLIAALFFLVSVSSEPQYWLTIWRVTFVTATAGSIALIAGFVIHAIRYRQRLMADADPSLYLRTGGFLHHWMIFAVVEILVFAAMLRYDYRYPEHRRWLRPAFAIHGLAILLSLTRALWLGALLLVVIHIASRRPRWLCAVPALPAMAFLIAPAPVRYRIVESFQPDYYSNAERLQMWRVGLKMIREHPVFGVGPGRVESLYTSYLAPGDPVPSYHGHLHNDAIHLAAQFGLPVLAAAVLFVAALLRQLWRARKGAADRESLFLCDTALLGTIGFLAAGLTDYVYGHSLGLILLSYVALTPLGSPATVSIKSRTSRWNLSMLNLVRPSVPAFVATISSRSRSLVRRSIARLAISSADRARNPVRLSSINSGIPPDGNAITGTASAKASMMTRGVASYAVDGTKSRSRPDNAA